MSQGDTDDAKVDAYVRHHFPGGIVSDSDSTVDTTAAIVTEQITKDKEPDEDVQSAA